MTVPRLRMFAGPNGSGKSTIKSVVSPQLLGHYLNPDEIEKQVKAKGYLDVRGYDLDTTEAEIIDFMVNHPLAEKTDVVDFGYDIKYINQEFISFEDTGFDGYMSAILTDFLRHHYVASRQSFTFETVMSSPDKVALLQKAQRLGYRTYLYYVATEDPAINLLRINHRVRVGGHPVPPDKVVSRYYRSLGLLSEAIKHTSRAFIFDNSGESKTWVAEVIDGTDVELKVDEVPTWFQHYVLEKLT